ncbi:Vi polysaccharide biosynthesis UDP-N-acetylglucosamine C-6 dehydrogenase TviB [Halomonas sp. 1390]|uniref:Vi polysaccharide biosynthesis UDP-N-acetylglucosamine C-6 dehydrogenase TviB n=1 Tax=Halomonas sp. B23F22_3 TaxID=3459516 RepID=UPI00373DF43B
MNIENIRLGVIGLGYVGLPLAVEFGKRFATVGFDIDQQRISELRDHLDHTREVEESDLAAATGLTFASDESALRECNVYIVTVPTPIDASHRPDLGPLQRASQLIGRVIGKGDVAIFESTVYPGATEEECVPIIETESGLRFNHDFFAGYSPERINPGDKLHRVTSIRKVVSGSTPETADFVESLYGSVIQAGTYRASSILVAEAAKVIENTQRDVNIALINELAMIFNRLGIDTEEVLEAAGTKWNFLPFRPGLVGGHCIGVDPYYLTYRAQQLGYHPEVILSGRRINDGMGGYVSGQLVKQMLKREMKTDCARVLVLGLTFKENCPDIRNTRVVDIVHELEDYHLKVDVHDPHADPAQALNDYGIQMVAMPMSGGYDAIIVAVAHQAFRELGIEAIRAWGRPGHLLFDLKYVFARESVDLRL